MIKSSVSKLITETRLNTCSNTASQKTKPAYSEAGLTSHLFLIIDRLSSFHAGIVSSSSEERIRSEEHTAFEFKVKLFF
jgi:hypothetical protein